MKITDVRDREKTVSFESLKPGAAFIFQDVAYVKTMWKLYSLSGDNWSDCIKYDSIILFSGEPDFIGPDTQVYPVNAEVVIS